MDSLKEKGGESPRIFFTLYQMILPSLSVSLETSMTYRPMMRKLVWWTTQIGFSMDSRMHFQIAIYMMTFQWNEGVDCELELWTGTLGLKGFGLTRCKMECVAVSLV